MWSLHTTILLSAARSCTGGSIRVLEERPLAACGSDKAICRGLHTEVPRKLGDKPGMVRQLGEAGTHSWANEAKEETVLLKSFGDCSSWRFSAPRRHASEQVGVKMKDGRVPNVLFILVSSLPSLQCELFFILLSFFLCQMEIRLPA